MPQFIQPPQQKYRPSTSNSRTQQNQPQQGGCSQFFFLLAILLLFNLLVMRACAPEEQGQTENSSLTQALQSVTTPEKMEPSENAEKAEAPAKEEDAPKAEVPAETPAVELQPAEVVNPEAAPAETAPAETTSPTDAMAKPNTNPVEYLTLGSVDPASPYRMLVTLTSEGAAVARVEMNEARLASMSDEKDFKGGYIGELNCDADAEAVGGALVQVVGDGTPAKAAGLLPGDRIQKVNDQDVANAVALTETVRKFRPGTKVSLTVNRAGQKIKAEAMLTREPVSVIRPEVESASTQSLADALKGIPSNRKNNASFLTTFYSFGEQSLSKLDLEVKKQIAYDDYTLLDQFVNQEILGFDMHKASWKVEASSVDSVTFLYEMPAYGMEVRKTYRLVQVEEKQRRDESSPTYHLTLNITVKNVGTQDRTMAIQQDGPTGLLTEGNWFCSKAGRGWGMTGIRDVLIGFEGNSTPNYYTCTNIAGGKWGKQILCSQKPLKYIGVDAQYFSSILIPEKDASSLTVERFAALRVGNVTKGLEMRTNTSCRVISNAKTLKPGEEATQQFTVFIGPKRPKLLSQYSLDNVVYYGWFSFIAKILVAILHFFYAIFGNYGIAILCLTALVRLLMFPLSKKQIMGSIIMQKLQPEVKRLNEKYQDPMERQRAQMELFRKYKYNPMSGCWVMLIQLPIFIALYRALLVDVELRQMPLFTESIRFCSNLVAPDMFFCWKDFMPTWVSSGVGIFGLGPYLNLLPILTIAIFIIQQKIMMPPALDEQAKMQQNMMKFMMIFMGFLFFKVPCGLCIYFIISSLWGLLERRFMPSADNFQLSTDGVIDMRVQNGTATSTSKPVAPKKEGFWARLAKKVEEIQKAAEARDAEIERRRVQEEKKRRRNKR
ncbi:MAG: membrane protein insertase YidC [Thermoguttaceae bacterium]|nr:membrane protein insertase YidC [Thermoguttaceae bacterium]